MSKAIRKSFIIFLFFILVLSFPTILSAQTSYPNPLQCDSIEQCVNSILNILFYVSLVLAPVMILVGAFYIITAGGTVDRVKTGKNIILYAAIGLALIAFAKGLVAAIRYLAGG